MDFDVNEELPERDFSTPLHLAVASGREDFVSVLLRHPKIDPNRPNRTGKRFPLHVAAEKGQARLVLPLLRSGADPDARMENGSSALHVLAARSAARWVQDEGLRPTVRREFVECARMLLEAVRPGANIDATNSIGVTPVAMAVEKGSQVNVKGGRKSKIFCALFHFLYCDSWFLRLSCFCWSSHCWCCCYCFSCCCCCFCWCCCFSHCFFSIDTTTTLFYCCCCSCCCFIVAVVVAAAVTDIFAAAVYAAAAV